LNLIRVMPAQGAMISTNRALWGTVFSFWVDGIDPAAAGEWIRRIGEETVVPQQEGR